MDKEKNRPLKTTKQYSEDKLYKIEGKGTKGEAIYNAYLTVIRDEYTMTVDEACYYIGCSYTYFITRLINKIYHIRINTAARKLIYLYSNIQGTLEEDLKQLVNKRILLSREDFFKYMKSSTSVEQQYKVFTFADFDNTIINEIQKNLDIYNSKHGNENFIKTKTSLFNDVISLLSSKNAPEKHFLPENFEMPEKFYSLKEIKAKWTFKHDVEVYRMLDANGAKKFMLCDGDFVRYDPRDFERKENQISSKPDDIVKMDYKSYLELCSKSGDAVQEIQGQVLKVSQKLANYDTDAVTTPIKSY